MVQLECGSCSSLIRDPPPPWLVNILKCCVTQNGHEGSLSFSCNLTPQITRTSGTCMNSSFLYTCFGLGQMSVRMAGAVLGQEGELHSPGGSSLLALATRGFPLPGEQGSASQLPFLPSQGQAETSASSAPGTSACTSGGASQPVTRASTLRRCLGSNTRSAEGMGCAAVWVWQQLGSGGGSGGALSARLNRLCWHDAARLPHSAVVSCGTLGKTRPVRPEASSHISCHNGTGRIPVCFPFPLLERAFWSGQASIRPYLCCPPSSVGKTSAPPPHSPITVTVETCFQASSIT